MQAYKHYTTRNVSISQRTIAKQEDQRKDKLREMSQLGFAPATTLTVSYINDTYKIATAL